MKKSKLGLIFLVGGIVVGLSGAGLITAGLVKTFNKSSSGQSITEKQIQSIYVSENPTRMIYLVGQTFDSTGMVVKAVNEDSTETVLEGWKVVNPEAVFAKETTSQEVKIEYTPKNGTKKFTTSINVRVVKSLDGVGEAIGLVPLNGPIIQKNGTKFNWDDLRFNVKYRLDSYVGVGEKVYKKGDNVDGNSYNTIKLKDDVTLGANTKFVEIMYSQGKAQSLDIVVATSVAASCKKASYAAKTDKFSFDDITLTADSVNGNQPTKELIKMFTWTDTAEGKLTEGMTFTVGGQHTVTASVGTGFTATFTFNVTGGEVVDPTKLPDNLKQECEDMTLGGYASYLKQTGTDYLTQFEDKGSCNYGEAHAACYLGYQGTSYACSGTGAGNLGGFVHNFDVKSHDESNPSTMTWTFNLESSGKADLIVRGATNDVARTDYIANELKVVDACDIYVNGVIVNDSLNQNAKFKGSNTGVPDTNAQRTGSAGAPGYQLGLEGRYLFLLWTDLNMGKISLSNGANEIKLVAKHGTSSGHWDCLTLDFAPYKD